MPSKLRVAILISGRGSNMESLLRACAGQNPDCVIDRAEIAVVVSNIAEAKGLETAAKFAVKTEILSHKGFANRRDYDAQMTELLRQNNIQLVCLAGFMRILSAEFCHEWAGRLINIHPSLLPEFKGLDTHKRAIEAGVKQHGCSVHFVTPGMDEGPIIVQESVPVMLDDTEQTLAARVLAAEHRCYPKVLKLYSENRIHLSGDTVTIDG